MNRITHACENIFTLPATSLRAVMSMEQNFQKFEYGSRPAVYFILQLTSDYILYRLSIEHSVSYG